MPISNPEVLAIQLGRKQSASRSISYRIILLTLWLEFRVQWPCCLFLFLPGTAFCHSNNVHTHIHPMPALWPAINFILLPLTRNRVTKCPFMPVECRIGKVILPVRAKTLSLDHRLVTTLSAITTTWNESSHKGCYFNMDLRTGAVHAVSISSPYMYTTQKTILRIHVKLLWIGSVTVLV